MRPILWLICGLVFTAGAIPVRGDEAPPESPAENESAAGESTARVLLDPAVLHDLVDRARRSVVVISFSGRSDAESGLGSGFIVAEDGLIATNLHVIGEARPISVKLLDGRKFDVSEIYATEKAQDLAILKIEAEGLPALPLGDADALHEGDPLIAIGNPQGLTHSVVTGVAGLRDEVQGMDMIQLAMPIERGNSGGPVLNLAGEVVGLVALKSLAKENVGFAVAANHLQPLLDKPNPIAMSHWLTIGVLNSRLWETPDDSNRWRQRAGRITAAGTGRGFGGRSMCLSKTPLPGIPYEVAVTLRMEESDGAAGLVFFCGGGDAHYGFYPSSGTLRLTEFSGPTVYQWNVLRDERSPAYDPDDWNTLKVRVEADRFLCYCNDQIVFEAPLDEAFNADGRVGIVKFRHTTAEFKNFLVGRDLPDSQAAPELIASIARQVRDIPPDRPPSAELLSALAGEGPRVHDVLLDQARLLEQRAERIRELSHELHAGKVRAQLVEELNRSPDEVNLLRAGLLVAALDNVELNVEVYEELVQDMADEFTASLAGCVAEEDRLDALQRYLFEEQGFHGSRTNYYSASNSYLNEVIDDREGLPITLSVLYIDLARRCGLKVVGVGMPQHFIVRFEPSEGAAQLIDPFDRGRKLSEREAIDLVESQLGEPWDSPSFEGEQPREIILRMLRNLIRIAGSKQDLERTLRYVDTVLALNPESPQDRLFKAVLCLNTGRIEEGLAETDWVLQRLPEEVQLEEVHRLRDALQALQPQ